MVLIKAVHVVVATVATLIGTAYSQQCEAFNDEPIDGATVTCTGGTPDAPADVGVSCEAVCGANTLPDVPGDGSSTGASTSVEYICSESIITQGCGDPFWATDVEDFSCSAPAPCPTFANFANAPDNINFDTIVCFDAADQPVDRTTQQIGHTCRVETCADDYEINTGTTFNSEQRSFECQNDGTGLSGDSDWEVVTAPPASTELCTRMKCPEFDTAIHGFPATEVSVACFDEDGIIVSPATIAPIGGFCRVLCNPNDGFPVDSTNEWTCVAGTGGGGPTYMNENAPSPAQCGTVTCGPFTDFISNVPDTNAGAAGSCSDVANTMSFDPTDDNAPLDAICQIATCGEDLELFAEGQMTYECNRDVGFPTTMGVWRPAGAQAVRCVPDFDCGAFESFFPTSERPNVNTVSCEDRLGVAISAGDVGDYGASCRLQCAAGSNFIDTTDMYTCGNVTTETWLGTANCALDCAVPTEVTNGDFECKNRYDFETDESEPQSVDVTCDVTCDEGFGFASEATSFTCNSNADLTQPSLYSTLPVCNAVECGAFNAFDITNAVFGQCNDGELDCTLDEANDNANTELGVSCEITGCASEFVLTDASEVYYTCNKVDDTSSGGWEPALEDGTGVSCNAACSQDAITSTDGSYLAECCQNRASGCPVNFGGCTDDGHCIGELMCGVANASCSDAINAVDQNARCCVEAPTPSPDENPDGASALDTHVATIGVTVVALVSFVFA